MSNISPLKDRWQFRYLQAVGIVILATILGFPFEARVSPTNLVMPYLAGVVIAASRLGRGPSIIGATLSVLAFDFFFVPPRFTLEVADTEYIVTFFGLLLVGLVISALVSQVREKTRTAREREDQTAALYALSRQLAATGDLDEICAIVEDHIEKIFGMNSSIRITDAKGLDFGGSGPMLDELPPRSTRHPETFPAAQKFKSRPAETPQIVIHREPLNSSDEFTGVIEILSTNAQRRISRDHQSLLRAMASQASLAIERAHLAEKAQEMEIVKATERFQAALLGSISHDLRTPLATITGVLSSLQSGEPDIPKASRNELVDMAYEEAERLNQFVGNLLEMTRIQGDALHLKVEETDVEELIGIALTMLESRIRDREIKVVIDRELPLIKLDIVLMSQVLRNVLDNAAKYSPAGSPIEIRATREGQNIDIRISDLGPGIPDEEINRIFDKFYRVGDGSRTPGIGLGLSISKGIVEAHDGAISALNCQGGGTEIRILLPLTNEGNLLIDDNVRTG